MSNIDKQALTDEAITKAFAGTNFGRDDIKNILAETVIDAAAGWRCGYTATTICTELGLLTPKGCASALGLRFISEHVQRETKRLKDGLEAKDKLIAEQVEIIAKQEKWIKDVEATMIAAADRAEAAEKQIAELTGKPAPVVPALLLKMDSWRGAPCNGVEWAKGYQTGWNKYHQWLSERRAAVLHGAEKTEPLHAVKASPLLNSSVKGIELQHADCQGEYVGNSPVILDGWVLVPVEPTPEMREAYHQAQGEYEDVDGLWSPDHQWQAMLAAAPQQEVKS